MMMDHGVLSDLISNSCEVSASSSLSGSRSNNNNNNHNNNSNNSNVVSGTRSSFCSQQANQPFASATQGLAPPRKRAHPDPDAEVIALSPKSLLAKNRFVCEICKKGFQRDQNLQLHRRGHNLPWKLKQRADKELVRKKVYICPEPTCAHHDPSRALGDLTGIKKHFCRKHGEKKWKCEKCTKCYAVQADWKAHSKICGTREYRCDCGTLFSRRDSFIAHRAFCNAMARVSSLSRSMLSQKNRPDNSPVCHLSTSSNNNPQPHALSIKNEQENLHHRHHPSGNPTEELLCTASAYLEPSPIHRTNPSPMLLRSTITAGTSSHMSATALLQRAAQMGVTMSKPSPSLTDLAMPHPQASPYAHHHTPETGASIAGSAGPVLSSGGEDHMMAAAGGSFFFLQGLDSFGTDEYLGVSSAASGENALVSAATAGEVRAPPRNTVSSPGAALLGSSYLNSSFSQEAPTGGIIRTNTSEDNHHHNSDLREKSMDPHAQTRGRSDPQGTTRDFLGLRAFSSVQEGLVDVSGFDLTGSYSSSMNNYKDTSDEVQNEDQYRSLWEH